MRVKLDLRILLMVALGIFQFAVLFFAFTWVYIVGHLELARRGGVYASPEAGMRQLIGRGYINIQKIQILHAGPNASDGSNPHVGFVVAQVWAERRADGSPMHNGGATPDFPGVFFLHMKDGWVYVGEGEFPEFIGFWMKVYGLAGG